MKRRTLVAALPAVLAGCATQSSVVDGDAIDPRHGVLALKISTNATQGFIGLAPYTPSLSAGITRELFSIMKENFDLAGGDNYFVRHMLAGEYMWNEMTAGMKRALLYSRSKITVAAKTVTYVGHINLTVFDRSVLIQVLDREDDMRQHLSGNYPKTLASLSFHKELTQLGLTPS